MNFFLITASVKLSKRNAPIIMIEIKYNCPKTCMVLEVVNIIKVQFWAETTWKTIKNEWKTSSKLKESKNGFFKSFPQISGAGHST